MVLTPSGVRERRPLPRTPFAYPDHELSFAHGRFRRLYEYFCRRTVAISLAPSPKPGIPERPQPSYLRQADSSVIQLCLAAKHHGYINEGIITTTYLGAPLPSTLERVAVLFHLYSLPCVHHLLCPCTCGLDSRYLSFFLPSYFRSSLGGETASLPFAISVFPQRFTMRPASVLI